MQRWAEPLDRMFERILAEDLRQRLPDSRILSESDTGTVGLRYTVETDIEQFNAVGDGQAALKAVLSLSDKSGAMKPKRIELNAPSGASPDVLASALSNLIGQYADRVQDSLRQQVLKRD
jgi:uncharacterized lipoprotein YmbA